MLINSAGLGLRWLDRGALGPLMRFFPLLLPLADLTICLEWLVLRKRAETRGPTARETLKSLGRGGGGVCGRMVGGGGVRFSTPVLSKAHLGAACTAMPGKEMGERGKRRSRGVFTDKEKIYV